MLEYRNLAPFSIKGLACLLEEYYIAEACELFIIAVLFLFSIHVQACKLKLQTILVS